MTTATPHPRATSATLLLLLLLALTACGGSSSGGGSSSVSDASSADSGSTVAEEPSTSQRQPALDTGLGASTSSRGAGSTAAGVTPLTRAVVSTGQLTLRVRQVATARTDVVRLTTAAGGSVADEETTGDDRGGLVDSTLTLRVPTARFAGTMDALARVGDVDQQSRSSQDVTTKVIDNDVRVRAAERSLRQIELLLGRATKLGDIIAIESDLARRQADLDSLKSQQAFLSDQTSLSTITVHLGRTDHQAVPAKDARGFLAGLSGGWHALRSGTVVLLTALGALLPFVVLLGLVAALALPLLRRLRDRRSVTVSEPSAPARTP